MVKASLLAIVARALAVSASVGANVLVSRFAGISDAGYFLFGLTVTNFFVLAAKSGLDNVLLRRSSVHFNQRTGLAVCFELTWAVKWLLVASSLIAFAGSSVYFLLSVPGEPSDYVGATAIMLCSAFPIATISVKSAVLKALGKGWLGGATEIGAVPFFFLLGLMVVQGRASSASEFAIVFVISSWVGLAAVSLLLRMYCMPSRKRQPENGILKGLLVEGFPLMIAALFNYLLLWIPVIFLSVFSTESMVAGYANSAKVAGLLSFTLVALNPVVAPRFAVMYSHKNNESLQNLYSKLSLILMLITAPCLVMIYYFSVEIMAIFGEGFAAAGPALAILATGQFINSSVGPVNYLLMMAGHGDDLRKANLISVTICICVGGPLIARFDLVGAALLGAASIALLNILSVFFVHRRLGILPFKRTINRGGTT